MMTKVFIYFFILSSILLLPDRIWEKIWFLIGRIYAYLKKLESQNPFKKEHVKGESLLRFLPDLEAKLAMGLKTTKEFVPQYKFYTGLLFILLEAHQKRGLSLKQILPELRINLTKDLQFESKLLSNTLAGNLQFFVITLTTWAFIFFSSCMAEIPLAMNVLLTIAFIQILGILVFNVSLKKLKAFTFNKFSDSFERLYLFTGLVEIGIPVGQTLTESRVLEGPLMTNKLFSPCASRLVTLINRWKENGISPKTEVQEIIREVWHLKEVNFERFLKHLDALKFIVLAFFFLPAYFFYLYSIFQFFMEQ